MSLVSVGPNLPAPPRLGCAAPLAAVSLAVLTLRRCAFDSAFLTDLWSVYHRSAFLPTRAEDDYLVQPQSEDWLTARSTH